MPWGHISGKWWGTQDVQPILALHGWQDNAGSFDRLIPLLPSHTGVLAIDFPGHGLSSRFPDGVSYKDIDFVPVLLYIMKEYNWDKISILSHSMGGVIALLLASIFPEKIEYIIALDALLPIILSLRISDDSTSDSWEKFIEMDERNRNGREPPCYTYDECIQKLCVGYSRFVDPDKCKYILTRNIEKSTKYPEKYYITRDSRLKYLMDLFLNQNIVYIQANKMKFPLLYIQASRTKVLNPEHQNAFLKAFSENPNFKFVVVEGKHHLHLNNPKPVSGLISEFINKYKKGNVVAKL